MCIKASTASRFNQSVYGTADRIGAKVNKLSCAELHELYPELPKFLDYRKQYDPDGVFLNLWLVDKFMCHKGKW